MAFLEFSRHTFEKMVTKGFLHKMTMTSKAFAIVVIIVFLPLSSFGQNNKSDLNILNHVKELINSNSYDKAIAQIDENLKPETSVSDSVRAELYYIKYLVKYWQGEESKKSIYDKGSLSKAIEIFESLENRNARRLAQLYKRILRIVKPTYLNNESINEYKTYIIKLFSSGGFYASDYEWLLYHLYAYECKHTDTSVQQHKIDSLTIDLKKQNVNPQYFSTYVKYITANLISRNYYSPGGAYSYGDDNAKRQAFRLYYECLKEYDNYKREAKNSTEPIDNLKAYCLDNIVDMCVGLQMYDIAAIFQRQYLNLIHQWWNSWEAKSPWHCHENISNHKMQAYENYMSYLESSNQYDKGIAYSRDVINEIDNYDIDSGTEYVESYIKRFENLKRGYLTKKIYGPGMCDKRLSDLYYAKDFDKLEQVADSILADCIRWIYDDLTSDNYIASFLNDESIKSTKEEDRLFAKRELWWFANGLTIYWEALSYKALVASHRGNTQQAIKCQEEVVDIVKADYKFQPNLRKSLIESHTYIELQYLRTEIYQYLNLAVYYFDAKRNRDAIKCLNIALKSAKDILYVSMFGSDLAKYDLWYNISNTLNEILFIAISYREECPEVADVVVDIFSVMKGVLQNEKISTRLAILNYTGTPESKSTLEREYRAKLELDRKIDLTYYTNQETEREELMLERALHQIQIDCRIDHRQIMNSSHVNIDKLKKLLCKGDLYLDLMPISFSSDTMEYIFIDSLRSDLYKLIRSTQIIYFAVVYKPEWKHARLIKVCDNISEIGDGVGALTEYTETNSKKVYKFYTSPTATNFIWGEILKEADLSEGSNIYFIPAGDLTSIAIEQMLMEDGIRVCDKYNCYRMTSAHEIERKREPYAANDKAAIFYNMNYSWVNSSQMLPSFKENLSNPHGDAIKNAMQQMFASNLKQYTGYFSTEQNMVALSGNSPAYLHLTTHGFKKLYGDLENDERDYLIGHRPEYQSVVDESMYRTGLYMSSSSWNKNLSNDGLLTSHEISLLDLSDTKLCVLSACSTASGHSLSEGVFGLQRAFKLAGVKTLIVSLWDVDDKATELLMSKFYEYLAQKLSPLEALQNSQLDVKNYVNEDDYLNGLDNVHRYENPYYWAGFVLLDAN